MALDLLVFPQRTHHHGHQSRARETCNRYHSTTSSVHWHCLWTNFHLELFLNTDYLLLQTIYVHQSTWYISFTAIIVTILILYLRIFPNQWLHRVSYAMGSLTVLWMVINIIVLTFQCTPVEFFWNHARKGGGHCIHANQYYATSCAISMVMLIFVFFMPIPIVRKLQITRSKKWGLGIAFGVGAL